MEEPEQPFVPDASNTCDNDLQAELTDAIQSEISPPLHPQITSPAFDSTIIDETAPLTFPTLSPDGSTEVLPTVLHNSFRPAPPAALSPLGRRSRMSRINLEDSTSSLDDVQYDMVDDASDFSNDDRETASLASTEQADGRLTPEDSIIDVEEERDDLDASTTLQISSDTLPGQDPQPSEDQIRAENELLDSEMTDTLETPRQALVRGLSTEQSPTRGSSHPNSTSAQELTPIKPKHMRLLFVSERGVSDFEVTRACKRLATCLATKNDNQISPEAVRLPPTPSGSTNSTMSILAGEIELTVYHCVYARWIHYYSKPRIFIRTDVGEHQSYISYFGTGVQVPDLALFYLTSSTSYPNWLNTAKDAIHDKTTLSMTVVAPGKRSRDYKVAADLSVFKNTFNDGSETIGSSQEDPASSRKPLHDVDLVVDSREYFNGSEEHLREDIFEILADKQKNYSIGELSDSSNLYKRFKASKAVPKATSLWILLHILLLLPLLYIGYQWSSTPLDQVVYRRALLSKVLVRMTNSTQAPNAYNVNHLIPEHLDSRLHVSCSGGATTIGAGCFMIATPPKANGRGYSQPTAWTVLRSNGQEIDRNVTMLIDGVYSVTIPRDDSYGEIHTSFLLKDPAMNGSCVYNLGNRILQRQLYDKMTTSISKVVTEDAAAAAKTFKSIKEKLGLELSAGAAASKNVTTQLAVYAARELQLYAHTGASLLEKIGQEAPGAMQRLNDRVRQDAEYGAAQAQRGFTLVYEGVEKGLQTTTQFTKDLIPTKAGVRSSLLLARQRALYIKNSIQNRKKEKATNMPATKEMRRRLDNFHKARESYNRAPTFKEMATCWRSKDYQACREEQKQRAMSLSTYQPSTAMAKMSDLDVAKKALEESFQKVADDQKKAKAPTEKKAEVKSAKPVRPVKGIRGALKGKGKGCKKAGKQ